MLNSFFSRMCVFFAITFWLSGFASMASALQHSMPDEIEVSQSTRIDWTFAVGQQSVDQVPDKWFDDYPAKQTYDFYLPESCDVEKSNGLILFVSPSPRAMAVKRWQVVCDELGLMLAAPHASGNQIEKPARTKIVLDVLDDVRRKHKIDPDRTYISGFSGGGRQACGIAFSLPEYFGGLIPIGSAGELRMKDTWLRKRVADRISVAYVIGSEDFNYCEVNSFRAPLLEAAGVRTTTLVIDGMPHEIPGSEKLIEAVTWLEEKAAERAELAARFPTTRIEAEQPTNEAQAQAFLDEGQEMMKDASTRFDGQMLLKGIAMRWPDSPTARQAGEVLMADTGWKETELEQLRQYAIHRCRYIDRFANEEKSEFYANQRVPRLQRAILNWNTIVQDGSNPTAVQEARDRIQVLSKTLEEVLEAEKKAADKKADK